MILKAISNSYNRNIIWINYRVDCSGRINNDAETVDELGIDPHAYFTILYESGGVWNGDLQRYIFSDQENVEKAYRKN